MFSLKHGIEETQSRNLIVSIISVNFFSTFKRLYNGCVQLEDLKRE